MRFVDSPLRVRVWRRSVARAVLALAAWGCGEPVTKVSAPPPEPVPVLECPAPVAVCFGEGTRPGEVGLESFLPVSDGPLERRGVSQAFAAAQTGLPERVQVLLRLESIPDPGAALLVELRGPVNPERPPVETPLVAWGRLPVASLPCAGPDTTLAPSAGTPCDASRAVRVEVPLQPADPQAPVSVGPWRVERPALYAISLSGAAGAAWEGRVATLPAASSGVLGLPGAQLLVWTQRRSAEDERFDPPVPEVRTGADLAVSLRVAPVPPSCLNRVRDPDEGGLDCGGPCTPCAPFPCRLESNCPASQCREQICAPSSCVDRKRGGFETDVDCGGPCAPCADGLRCVVGADCASGVCGAGADETGVCAPPSPTDGLRNGSETDVDCGGSQASPCADGDRCRVPGDCLGGGCADGVCVYRDPCEGVRCDVPPDPCHGAGACQGGACVYPPRGGGPCDDGDACTRDDVCAADGTCTGESYVCAPGVCELRSVCDGRGGCVATPAPEGAGCAPDEPGTWSGCAWPRQCGVPGTRTRSVVLHACTLQGGCNARTVEQTEACSVPADAACADDVLGEWSECLYDSVCAAGGQRARSVTLHRCQRESCVAQVFTESQASADCHRDMEAVPCGEARVSAWTSCRYASICALEGVRSRTVTQPLCRVGACETVVSTETEACTRRTEGNSCGNRETTAWGACEYASTCATTGVRTRSVLMPRCNTGRCQTDVATETDSTTCRRSVEGLACGAGTVTGDWSECVPSTVGSCASAGTRTRDVRTYRCVQGGCAETVVRESATCTRMTEDQPCGSGLAAGEWSACQFEETCATDGRQTRSVTGYLCRSGTCVVSSQTETAMCERPTDGTICGTESYTYVCGTQTERYNCRTIPGPCLEWTTVEGCNEALVCFATTVPPGCTLLELGPLTACAGATGVRYRCCSSSQVCGRYSESTTCDERQVPRMCTGSRNKTCSAGVCASPG